MPVKPPTPKHKSEELRDKLIILIPNPKHWFMEFFLGLWLVFWSLGELLALGALIFNRNGIDAPPIPFLVIWLIFWTIGGGFMIYQFAWQVSGKEVVEVTPQSITISRVVLSFHSPKEYSADYIKELRVSSSNMNLNHPMLLWTYSYYYPWRHNMIGSMAFDYGAQTFRFGMSIDEAEAKQIIAEIQQKFPQYKN
jgi:hypothetical protein